MVALLGARRRPPVLSPGAKWEIAMEVTSQETASVSRSVPTLLGPHCAPRSSNHPPGNAPPVTAVYASSQQAATAHSASHICR